MKKYLIAISIFAVLVVLYLGFLKLMYTNSGFSCGKIIDQEEIRGTVYYIYKFDVGEEEYSGSGVLSNRVPLSDLKKMDCIKIRYSKWSPSFNKIEDPRIKIRE